MKCPLCKTGSMIQSGTQQYCDKCVYSSFVVTDDYVQACTNVLAVLCSNTQFNNDQDYEAMIERYIVMHMPQLWNWIESTVSGRQRMISAIAAGVKDSAVNIEVPSLVCTCGSHDFHMLSVSELSCKRCAAGFRYDQENDIYVPAFKCECGSIGVQHIEDNLVACRGCNRAYLHDSVNGVYRLVQ